MLDGGPTHKVLNREEGDLVQDSARGVIEMRKGISDRDEGAQSHEGEDDNDDGGGQLCVVGWCDQRVRVGDWDQRVDDGPGRVEPGQDARVRCTCRHSKSISNMDWDADIHCWIGCVRTMYGFSVAKRVHVSQSCAEQMRVTQVGSSTASLGMNNMAESVYWTIDVADKYISTVAEVYQLQI